MRAVHWQKVLVRACGDVIVSNRVEVRQHQRSWNFCPFSLPRVGLTFRLPFELSSVSWLGRGPHENYPDRKSSAFVDRYTMAVDDLHTPYIVPSENGHRCDVRSLELRSSQGVGLCFFPASGDLFGFSASRHTMQSLELATHTNELVNDRSIHLHVDHRMMGVGGDASWVQSVYRKYWIPAGVYTWAVRLVPFAGQLSPELDEFAAVPAELFEVDEVSSKSSWWITQPWRQLARYLFRPRCVQIQPPLNSAPAETELTSSKDARISSPLISSRREESESSLPSSFTRSHRLNGS